MIECPPLSRPIDYSPPVPESVSSGCEKDNDAAQKEVQELQRVMEPKRARTHAATADDDEECETSLVTTGTSLIIVGRLHAFKTTVQFLSALAEKFQVRRKARPDHWSILTWGLWDGLRSSLSGRKTSSLYHLVKV